MNIIHGDCLEELKKLEDNSVDAVVTDPPYGLSNTKPQQVADVLKAWVTGDTETVPTTKVGFMGASWDSFVPPPAVWEECMRVLKPGGHMAVFAGARTQDLMGLSIRLAGFEIRDTLGWVYGCLSEDTEVLINGKWEKYHEAKPGDLALCYDREHDTYEWQPIEDTHKYEYSDTAYRIRSNNTDQIVSRNHRVLVERGGAYEFEYAENLARERQIRVPILESLPTLLDDLSVRESLPGDEEPILQRELRSIRPSTGCGETDGETRNDGDCVCGLRNESLQTERLAKAGGNSDVFQRVQREVARGGMEEARTQRPSGMVGGNRSAVRGEYARGEQPSLEGRGDVETPEGELQGCSVCEVPAGVPEHVAEGWVCDGASPGGGASHGQAFAANRGCASCESRAGGQSVGEPVSVRVEPGPQAVRGARYTASDLAGIEPVHYEGIVWCLTVPTGAFVVRRNGKVFVTGNSGFPKSMDISKAIDKAAGAEREVVGSSTNGIAGGTGEHAGEPGSYGFRKEFNLTAPATSEAKQWDGWGTALKPAIEPIILARKPLDGTVANNVLAHGVGGLNIDACRVGSETRLNSPAGSLGNGVNMDGGLAQAGREPTVVAGRFPANVLLDEHAAKEMDKQSGNRRGFAGGGDTPGEVGNDVYGKGWKRNENPQYYSDEGGASRFFPVFKSEEETPEVKGRFPANVLLDEHAAAEMDEQSGPAGAHGPRSGRGTGEGVTGWMTPGTRAHPNDSGGASRFFPVFKSEEGTPETKGRFPANVLLDEHAAAEMDEQSGPAGAHGESRGGGTRGMLGWQSDNRQTTNIGVGGASRFFPVFKYQAKAPKKERPVIEREDGTKIQHSTVKPLALMEWLVSLIVPPGGVVLDPFAGSGTTLQAALNKGFTPIGIEQDADYIKLIEKRLEGTCTTHKN